MVQGSQALLWRLSFISRMLRQAPETIPTAKQYLTESRDFLQGQKAKILGIDAPRRFQDAPRELDQFLLDVEIAKDRVTMSYYVARQAKGGATLAARLPTSDLPALKKEVDAIALRPHPYEFHLYYDI